MLETVPQSSADVGEPNDRHTVRIPSRTHHKWKKILPLLLSFCLTKGGLLFGSLQIAKLQNCKTAHCTLQTANCKLQKFSRAHDIHLSCGNYQNPDQLSGFAIRLKSLPGNFQPHAGRIRRRNAPLSCRTLVHPNIEPSLLRSRRCEMQIRDLSFTLQYCNVRFRSSSPSELSLLLLSSPLLYSDQSAIVWPSQVSPPRRKERSSVQIVRSPSMSHTTLYHRTTTTRVLQKSCPTPQKKDSENRILVLLQASPTRQKRLPPVVPIFFS